MASFYANGPAGTAGSGGSSNASVGLNGAAAPTSSTEIGFIVGGNLEPVSSANPLPVTILSSPTPQDVNLFEVAGAATAVGTGASDGGTQRVILSSDSPLAPGAATSANQTTEIASIDSFSAKSASAFINVPFDETQLTYVGATTQIATVTYLLASVVQNTLTLTYDGSNRLIDVVKT